MDQKYVIVRTQNAGAFAGELKEVDIATASVVLTNARRLWYWAGASSLSGLAVYGTSKPNDCKFPIAVPSITLLGVIEIIDTTKEGQKSITEVPEWRS